nr:AMP-binding protein [Micromonospora sp. ANENR4]
MALFAASVRRHPDRPAVSEENRTLTYRELDAAASHLARALRARGVRGEQRVAVNLPRGVDVIVAILGILRAGGAYVPVDTLYPDHRRDLMISVSGTRYTITSASLTGARVPTTPAPTVAELTEATVSTSEVLPAVEAGRPSPPPPGRDGGTGRSRRAPGTFGGGGRNRRPWGRPRDGAVRFRRAGRSGRRPRWGPLGKDSIAAQIIAAW